MIDNQGREVAPAAPAKQRSFFKPVSIGRQPVDYDGQIFFLRGKAQLDQRDQEVLDALAKEADGDLMGRRVTVSFTGHADDLGKEADNQTLSERRATVVRDYLYAKIGTAFPDDRLKLPTSGQGETQATGHDAYDRRVDVRYRATGREQKIERPEPARKQPPMKVLGGQPRKSPGQLAHNVTGKPPGKIYDSPNYYLELGANVAAEASLTAKTSVGLTVNVLANAMLVAYGVKFIYDGLKLLSVDRNRKFDLLLGGIYGSVQSALITGGLAELPSISPKDRQRIIRSSKVPIPGGVPASYRHSAAFQRGFRKGEAMMRKELADYASIRFQLGSKATKAEIKRANRTAAYVSAVRKNAQGMLDSSVGYLVKAHFAGDHQVFYQLKKGEKFDL